MPSKRRRVSVGAQAPYVIDGPDERIVRPWSEVKPKLEIWLQSQLRTEEQIADAIDKIRGKKDVVALAKRLKYFFGPKTVFYGVREVTNQRTDAAKVVIKCFCIETRGYGETEETMFIVHGVAKGGVKVMSFLTLLPVPHSLDPVATDRVFVNGHEGEIDSELNLMICSKIAGFILGYCKQEKTILFYLFEKCDTLVASYQMLETVYSMKYSSDFGHLFLACRGQVKRFMLSTSKSGGYNISIVPLSNLATPMSASDVVVGMRIDELECHINLFCERDVYNADFEENKPLSRYTCMHGGQAKITSVVILSKHNYLLTGANDGSVKVWNLSTMMEVSVLTHEETHPVTTLAVTETRAVTLLLIGFSSGVILLWRLDYLKIAQRIEMPTPVLGLGWITDNDFYAICTCGIFVYDVRGIYIMYSYTTGEFPFIERVQNHPGIAAEILVANSEGEIFTLSAIHGVVTSDTSPLIKPWPTLVTPFSIFLEQSHEALFQLYPDGGIMAFSRAFFCGTPLCRYYTPDLVIKPPKPEKKEKEKRKDGGADDDDSDEDSDDDSEDSDDDSDDEYSDDSESDSDSEGGGEKKSGEQKKIIIRKRVNAIVHSSMNRLTGGQAKNEKDIMMQLKSTVHGGGALDDMPNAVSDSDDMALFAGMIDGTIVLVDSINYVMDEPVEAHKETLTHLFLAKRNLKMEDDKELTAFDHLATVGYDAKDGPRALRIWSVFYNLEKVVAPSHLKGRAAERYIRRGPKYFRNIGITALLEVNLGNANPIETKMIGNVFAFTRPAVHSLEMYALQSPGMPGELIRYFECRPENAHVAVPNSVDANDSLMIFVTTSLGGNVKIWGAQNNLLRNIYFEKDLLYGAGFINKKGDLLISYDGILLCVPGDAYLTPFVVEEMLNDVSFAIDDVSAKPLVRLPKAKAAVMPKSMADTPTYVVCSGERKKLTSLEAELAPEASTTRRRKDFGEQEGVQLKLEKKKKVEEEKPKEEGEYGPFGYLYKRVIVDPERSWIDGLTRVRDHYLDKLRHLPKLMTRENRRAYKHYDYAIVRGLEFLDVKLGYPHHKAIDEHFFVPTLDYEINQAMLDKLQKEVEDKERHFKRITTIPPQEEQRLTNLRALAIAVEGDEALEQKARYQLSTIRAEMGSLRYPATFRDHILGKWTKLSPEEIEAIMVELMYEFTEEQKMKKEALQNDAAATGVAAGAPMPVAAAAEVVTESQNQNKSQKLRKREKNVNNNNKINGKNENCQNNNINNGRSESLTLPPICASSPSSSPSSSASPSSAVSLVTLPAIRTDNQSSVRPKGEGPPFPKQVLFSAAPPDTIVYSSSSTSCSNVLPLFFNSFQSTSFRSPPSVHFRYIPRASSKSVDVDDFLQPLVRGHFKKLRELLLTQQQQQRGSVKLRQLSHEKESLASLMWNRSSRFDEDEVEEFLQNLDLEEEWFRRGISPAI